MGNTKKGGFRRVFKEDDILEVLYHETSEIRTATMLKRLAERDSSYAGKTHRGLAITLNKIAHKEIPTIKKIKKEDEIADYWVITEAGIKTRDAEKESSK